MSQAYTEIWLDTRKNKTLENSIMRRRRVLLTCDNPSAMLALLIFQRLEQRRESLNRDRRASEFQKRFGEDSSEERDDCHPSWGAQRNERKS